ncbi:unnamed protein product [Auanema sp. JU1783]|nr:unnamed protein product [Auanema sp. JU1783]
MLRILSFFTLLPYLSSYKFYADPLVVATPNKNVYEFDMVLTKKLTMSYSNFDPYKHTNLVDYDPTTKSWSSRDPDQLKPCNSSFHMNIITNSADASYLEDVLVLDGLHKRVIAINGHSPGETLVVPLNSEVLLKVRNNLLLDSVTIHIHGLDKKYAWYTDGVAFVQQCPITSTTYYEYRFRADRIGTHWLHGHMQSDRGDGLLAGFVVVDTDDRSVPKNIDERVTPDKEYMMMLQDWATTTNEDSWMMLDEKVMKWMYGFENTEECWMPTRLRDGGNVGGAVPISAILVNEKGWHDQKAVQERPLDLPLEIFRVEKGENVLLRIVNGGIAQELMIHIEDHDMTLVAADGNEVKPMNISRLIIFPGERYDILVQAKTDPKKQYYPIHVETIQFYSWDWTKLSTTYGFAFISYNNMTKSDDDYKPPDLTNSDCNAEAPCKVFNCPFRRFAPEYNYTCIHFDTLQNGKDIDSSLLSDNTQDPSKFEEYFINMHFDSHVNGYKFEYPTGLPYYEEKQFDAFSKPCDPEKCPKNSNKYDRNCNCFYHLKHKLGNIVQLTIYNMGLGGGYGTGYAHPFHIHGTHFYVVKVGWPTYNSSGMIENMNSDILCDGPEANCDDSSWTDSAWKLGALPDMRPRPAFRDTVLLPVGGYITIRFRAENPGWWFAHCHLVLHHMGGTAYAFKVGEDDEIPEPPENFPHTCGQFVMDKLPSEVKKKKSSTTHSSTVLYIIALIITYLL